MRLKDKVALVTGGAQGFGQGIGEAFAREGAKLALADLQGDLVKATAQAIGPDVLALQADVASDAAVKLMVAMTLAAFGRIDIIVNNAGTTHINKPMLDVTEAEFDRIFNVNVKSVYHTVIHGVPVFRRQGGGVFLNIASSAAIRPRPGLTVYNASKGAVNVMTKSMAAEFAPDKIRVNALCPVAGDTPLLASFLGSNTRDAFVKTVPLGRLSTPRDVANAALYLCSDEADFITGVLMEIDGGRCV